MTANSRIQSIFRRLCDLPFAAADALSDYLMDNWDNCVTDGTKNAIRLTAHITKILAFITILAAGLFLIGFSLANIWKDYTGWENPEMLTAEAHTFGTFFLLLGYGVIYGILRSAFEKEWFSAGMRYLAIPFVVLSLTFLGVMLISQETIDKLNALTVVVLLVLGLWLIFSAIHLYLWVREVLPEFKIPETHIAVNLPIKFTRLTAVEWEEVMKNRASRN